MTKNGITIERNFRKLEYNNLITDLSKLIYDYALKHDDI